MRAAAAVFTYDRVPDVPAEARAGSEIAQAHDIASAFVAPLKAYGFEVDAPVREDSGAVIPVGDGGARIYITISFHPRHRGDDVGWVLQMTRAWQPFSRARQDRAISRALACVATVFAAQPDLFRDIEWKDQARS